VAFEVTLKVNKKVPGLFTSAKNKTLETGGLIIVEETASRTHVITGTLKNSWQYRTNNTWSGFGTGPQSPEGQALTTREQISAPTSGDRVNVGSGLVYAPPYERRFAVLATSADISIKSIRAAAAKIWAEEFK
jgi:hypothetical protein